MPAKSDETKLGEAQDEFAKAVQFFAKTIEWMQDSINSVPREGDENFDSLSEKIHLLRLELLKLGPQFTDITRSISSAYQKIS